MSTDRGGRPICWPSNRARRIPAFTLSTIRFRSSCRAALKTRTTTDVFSILFRDLTTVPHPFNRGQLYRNHGRTAARTSSAIYVPDFRGAWHLRGKGCLLHHRTNTARARHEMLVTLPLPVPRVSSAIWLQLVHLRPRFSYRKSPSPRKSAILVQRDIRLLPEVAHVALYLKPGLPSLIPNSFPRFNYSIVALKSRTAVLKSRTSRTAKFVRDFSATLERDC
jgi:hypothetical protein